MVEFTKITEQRVRHISGYEVYSAGREYIGYKDSHSSYKIFYEFGWDKLLKKGIEYIYSNSIYDENLNPVVLSDKDRESLIAKVVKAETFMTDFRIEIVDVKRKGK